MILNKTAGVCLLIILLILNPPYKLKAQSGSDYRGIDMMLLRGDYENVIDTCRLILKNDSLNHEIFYKLGIAYQNTLNENMAVPCLKKAAELSPDNQSYNLALARTYFSRGKPGSAEPLFLKLHLADSLNWLYANYLSNIYIQSSDYDKALAICNKFLSRDSANTVCLDRTAYAFLKKRDFEKAVSLYDKSLTINKNNLAAIKNLAFIYAATARTDTAIAILTQGIAIDSTDLDLYVSRAQINYSKNYTKRALDDYLTLLAAGDSSKLYIKRAGIGYCYNLQPDKAVEYLLRAYMIDSSDYETTSFLAQSYNRLNDYKNSIRFYNKTINILNPVKAQLSKAHLLCAESQKEGGNLKDAITSYQKAFSLSPDPSINIFIANIYDEKLGNVKKAVEYYQRYLNSLNDLKGQLPASYIKQIEDRVKYLQTKTR